MNQSQKVGKQKYLAQHKLGMYPSTDYAKLKVVPARIRIRADTGGAIRSYVRKVSNQSIAE